MSIAEDIALVTARPSGQSMADRAYAYLVTALSNGSLKGGDVIQESRLADHLNLSRTPVRDALGRLEGEGLLVRSDRGLAVRRVTIKEFLDILFVRRLLEPEAAYLACGRLDPDILRNLRDRVIALNPAEANSDQWTLDEDVHLSVVQALNNDHLADLVRNLRRRTRLFELTEFPGHASSGRRDHIDLLDALIRGDREAAKAVMQRHLDDLRTTVIDAVKKM